MRSSLCDRLETPGQIVLADWRSGTSRTVFRTDHSFLYTARRRPCQLDVFDTVNGYNGEDPSEPGRAEVRHGYVFVWPTGGGKQIRLPGHIASTSGWPVANGDLVTYSIRDRGRDRGRDHGRTRIRVVLVTPT